MESREPDIVYMLGAGVSAALGYPVVSDFNARLLEHKVPEPGFLGSFIDSAKFWIRKFPSDNIESLIALANKPTDKRFDVISSGVVTAHSPDTIGQQYVVNPIKTAVIHRPTACRSVNDRCRWYNKSPNNVTLAAVYTRRAARIIQKRHPINEQTLKLRK